MIMHHHAGSSSESRLGADLMRSFIVVVMMEWETMSAEEKLFFRDSSSDPLENSFLTSLARS